jgi:hypothetical protein
MLLVGKADAAQPMLLIYPRLKARRLFCELSRVIGMDSQLSDVPPGADHRDLLNSQNNRMKSIAVERLFLPTFFSCSKKVGWTMPQPRWIRLKNGMDASMRSICFWHNMRKPILPVANTSN